MVSNKILKVILQLKMEDGSLLAFQPNYETTGEIFETMFNEQHREFYIDPKSVPDTPVSWLFLQSRAPKRSLSPSEESLSKRSHTGETDVDDESESKSESALTWPLVTPVGEDSYDEVISESVMPQTVSRGTLMDETVKPLGALDEFVTYLTQTQDSIHLDTSRGNPVPVGTDTDNSYLYDLLDSMPEYKKPEYDLVHLQEALNAMPEYEGPVEQDMSYLSGLADVNANYDKVNI
jgi:hypothetical protein